MHTKLLGQPVRHNSFGKGIISNLSGNVVTVQFSVGEKKFLYPEAFWKFLTLKDEKRQEEITEKYNEKMRDKQAKIEELSKNREYEKKILNLKINSNSQAAFDISINDIEKTIKSGTLSTGFYLTGYSKGDARVPSRLKPNSACLITSLTESGKEIERRILGVFMVREDFFGEQCSDGIVKGHDRYKVYVPADVNLSYWNYFDNNGSVPRWSRVPFRYFSNLTMKKILLDMTELFTDTNQEEVINEFYRYFCEFNCLPIEHAKKGEKNE